MFCSGFQGKQGNASKYFCATGEILRNCSPPPPGKYSKEKREGYIIAAKQDTDWKINQRDDKSQTKQSEIIIQM